LVAAVILPDGRSLNEELLRQGMAWWYCAYSTHPALGQLEEQARAAHVGLWADPHPVAPWEWRSDRRDEAPRTAKRGKQGKKHGAKKREGRRSGEAETAVP
jgi:endonuclease YncB( thermonuclease family)